MDTQNLNTIPDQTQERWLPIPGFPGYDVSDQGRVRSYWRMVGKGKGNGPGTHKILDNKPQKIYKPHLLSGYPTVTLFKGDKQFVKTVHRLMLLAFVGPCPPGHETRHLDGVKTNCILENLCWGTHSENKIDRFRHGLTHQGMNKPGGSKLTDDQVLKIRSLYFHGHLQKDIAEMFNISSGHICEIINRKTWTHLP